ncbi:hypothetical protein MycrhDRAFT_1451 [Mycolicibacterium rhodesiae JS60]|nr:hypothetical protein MycrhDRAFT_1451 [Mycolicibacterium rhodesiae JS60]
MTIAPDGATMGDAGHARGAIDAQEVRMPILPYDHPLNLVMQTVFTVVLWAGAAVALSFVFDELAADSRTPQHALQHPPAAETRTASSPASRWRAVASPRS